MAQQPKHIMDIVPRFRAIVEDIEQIKRHVVEKSGISYTSQDARMVAFDSLQISISAVAMWIQCCNSLANFHTKQNVFNEKGFLESVGSGVNREQTEMIMFDHLRLGFMTLVHFKIDNLFSNILRDLNALPNRKGYWNLTDAILDQCSISKTGTEKQILTAFANLRNSLHGNGIHRTDNLEIEIEQMEFKFIKGSRVECASWEHICVLLKANVEILNTLMRSNKLQNIRHEIQDDFALGA
jgi:hypothetical protein